MRRRNGALGVATFAGLAALWSCSSGGSKGGGTATAPSTTTPGSTTNPGTNPGTTPPATNNPVLSGLIAVPYQIVDASSATHSVVVEYSTDGGTTFYPCTKGPGGDPTTGLASSPTGVAHTFDWDTAKDLGSNLVKNVQVRVTPSGQGPSVSPIFDVDDTGVPTANVAFDRGPYLQGTTRTGVTIVWRTTTPTDSVVEYGQGSTYTQASAPGTGTTHAVTITGLTAGATFHYRIRANGAVATYPSTFATAADTSATGFTVLAFGDSGSGTQKQYDLATRMAKESFDFAVHLGDVIYPDGAEKDYNPNYFVPYQPFIASHPVFPAMGNHDQMTANGQAYFDAFYVNANNPSSDKRYYSFEWGDAKFVSIETYVLFQQQGPHLTWLQNELASNTRRWLVVMMHVPLFSVGFHGDNYTLQNLLGPIFEQYKVDLVLQGHDHNYERTGPIKHFSNDPNWKGIPYMVLGGGGADTYPVISHHPETQYSEAMFHYGLLTFTHDAIRGKITRLDGSIAESFTINHQ